MKFLKLIFFIFLYSGSAFCSIKTDSTDSDRFKKDQAKAWNRFLLDIGFNQLENIPAPLELNAWRSKGVNLYYYHRLKLIKNNLTLNPGFGLGLDNYSFSNDVLVGTSSNGIFQYLIDSLRNRNILKTKLSTNYLDFPLELRFKSSDNDRIAFRVAIGAKIGVLFNAHSKIKYVEDGFARKSKTRDDFGLNQFRYGIIGRIGFSYFNMFGYYSLSKLFENGKGPDVMPFMFGITFSNF
jgi:hypothetical protein